MIKKKSNYRKIPVSLPQSFLKRVEHDLKLALKWENLSLHTLRYILAFLVVSSFMLGLYLVFTFVRLEQRKEHWLRARDNLVYWEEVATKQKNSPDAYFEAAYYSYQLGDKIQARQYLKEALILDPGFDKARELDQLLTKTTK